MSLLVLFVSISMLLKLPPSYSASLGLATSRPTSYQRCFLALVIEKCKHTNRVILFVEEKKVSENMFFSYFCIQKAKTWICCQLPVRLEGSSSYA